MDMPLIGLGTYQVKGDECIEAVVNALRLGYRLIDTARCYKNESEIGIAIMKSGIPREDIFITSKIAPTDHGEESAYKCVMDTLANLQTSYLDLILIHWPGASKRPPSSIENQELRRASWKGLMRAKQEGLVKHIGVSNFMISHLDDFIHTCHFEEIPYLNQVECHPLCNQQILREYCQLRGIKFQSYSSLGQASDMLLHHPNITSLSLKYKVSTTELLLLWALQQSPPIFVIPKARSVDHLERNLLIPWRQYFDSTSFINHSESINAENVNNSDGSISNDIQILVETPSQQNPSQLVEGVIDQAPLSPFHQSSLLSLDDMKLLNNMNINHHFCWDPNTVL